jgi:site-specific DNA-methyltransferase (adenine-specific)
MFVKNEINMKEDMSEEEGRDVIDSNEVIRVPLSGLKPHPISLSIYDARGGKKAIKVLAKTMKLLGQLEPITINTSNEIISGVRRFRAALFLGWSEINAIKVPKTDNEAELIVFHNQQRRKTTLEIIHEAEAILGTLGKSQGARRDLLGVDATNPFGKIGRDRFEIAASVIGDVSASHLRRLMDLVEFERESEENKAIGLVERIMNNSVSVSAAHTLMKRVVRERKERDKAKPIKVKRTASQDDFSCFNKSSKTMEEVKTGSVQVVFTSPPYYNLRNYENSTPDNDELGLEDNVHDYIKNLGKHLKDVKRVLKENGSFFLNIGETYNRGENLLVSTRLLLQLCDANGWHLVNEIIWKKTNVLPQPSDRRLQPTYEKIFHLVKNPDKYFYQEIKLWNDNEHRVTQAPGGRNNQRRERRAGGVTLTRSYQKFKDFIEEQSVKDIIVGHNAAPRQIELSEIDASVDHPALMPNYLPVIPILSTSQRGDIILDPFSGSATTGRAALLLGRKYIGYELNENNYNLGLQDLQNCLTEVNESDLNSLEQIIEKKEDIQQLEPAAKNNPEEDDFFADF